jgi:hypothetical protein
MPDHLATRAVSALRWRARQKAEAEINPAEEVKKAKSANKDQFNVTDPESRIMQGGDGFVQGATTRRR